MTNNNTHSDILFTIFDDMLLYKVKFDLVMANSQCSWMVF